MITTCEMHFERLNVYNYSEYKIKLSFLKKFPVPTSNAKR